MKENAPAAGGSKETRKNRLLRERVHDPYKSRRKIRGTAVCPGCGALYQKDRWVWGPPPQEPGQRRQCPACQRIRDRVPAGFVTLSGRFLAEHGGEILNLAKNVGAGEMAAHPLKRIMNIQKKAGSVLITTTDAHLARGIGEAVHNAYRGALDLQYSEEDATLRVNWNREE